MRIVKIVLKFMTNWKKIKIEVANGNTLSFYSSSEWRAKREEIKKRDHYICQRCSGKFFPKEYTEFTRAQVVHHIVPLKQDFSKCLENSNLVSLCFRCHEEIEGRADFEKVRKKKCGLTKEKW